LLAAAPIIFPVTKNTARPELGPGFQKMEAFSLLVNLRERNAELEGQVLVGMIVA